MRFMNNTEERFTAGRNKFHKPDSDIFGPPVIPPRPKPRIRMGVSEEELAKIWREDEAKYQAALKMEKGTNLVEKMVADPIHPIVPNHRAKDAVAPGRRQVELLSETQIDRNVMSNAPPGFSGMGAHSKNGRRVGVACRIAEEQPEPRATGRRTKFLPNTLSHQDESQTYQPHTAR